MYRLTLILVTICCAHVHAESITPTTKASTTPPPQSPSMPMPINDPSQLGWSVSGLTGLNSCLPSGTATCDETYPGINLGLSTEYRWEHIGLMLNLDWGNLTPSGTGSENTSNTFGHLGLGLRYYYPYQNTNHFYAGASLGMGEAEVSDQKSDSAVQWSSWWSDLRLDLGTLWVQSEHWSLESALSVIIHMKGTRCIIFQGAGPCQAIEDLDPRQQSTARIVMLRFGARWTL